MTRVGVSCGLSLEESGGLETLTRSVSLARLGQFVDGAPPDSVAAGRGGVVGRASSGHGRDRGVTARAADRGVGSLSVRLGWPLLAFALALVFVRGRVTARRLLERVGDEVVSSGFGSDGGFGGVRLRVSRSVRAIRWQFLRVSVGFPHGSFGLHTWIVEPPGRRGSVAPFRNRRESSSSDWVTAI